MPDSYTELWSSHRIALLKKAHQEGARLEVLFGGPHSSLPSHKRYGVRAGDYLLAPTCTYEAVIGEEGTPIKLGIAVPGDVLERLEYRSRRGVRKPNIKDGKLQNWMSVWGIYRLTPASAEAVDALLTSQLDGATSAMA
jgi:hypothetical protein